MRGLVGCCGKWEDRTVWVEQRTRTIGKSLIVVIDVARNIRDRGDSFLVFKYKLWIGFGFQRQRNNWKSNV